MRDRLGVLPGAGVHGHRAAARRHLQPALLPVPHGHQVPADDGPHHPRCGRAAPRHVPPPLPPPIAWLHQLRSAFFNVEGLFTHPSCLLPSFLFIPTPPCLLPSFLFIATPPCLFPSIELQAPCSLSRRTADQLGLLISKLAIVFLDGFEGKQMAAFATLYPSFLEIQTSK